MERAAFVVAIAPSAQTLDDLAQTLERMVLTRPTVGDAACALLEMADARGAVELANELAPEHLELIGADVEALAADRALCRMCVRGRGERHCVWRLCGGFQPRAADRWRGSLCLGAVGQALPQANAGGAKSARTRWASLRRRARPIARAEGFEVHAESMEARMRENPDQ